MGHRYISPAASQRSAAAFKLILPTLAGAESVLAVDVEK